MENIPANVSVNQLGKWLEENKEIVVLDVRPKNQREEWQIPGSVYIDAYERLKANDPSVLDGLALTKNVPVVTVCAAGKVSLIAAEELRKKGFNAYSLEGGMNGWVMAWNKAEMKLSNNIELIQVRRTGKGCLSYIIASGGLAIIVDPSLDVADYNSILVQKKLRLKYVLETHVHADHLSRARMLAESTNATLFLPSESNVHFSFTPLKDGDEIGLGNIHLRVLYTPGHTLDSTCFLVNEEAILTGDTLFTNSVGRPDLKADAETTKEKAKLLYHSIQKLMRLKGDIMVLPAHTSKPVAFDGKMLGASLEEIKKSISVVQLDEASFVAHILQRIPPTPANYLTIAEKNIEGSFEDVNPLQLEAGANRCAISHTS